MLTLEKLIEKRQVITRLGTELGFRNIQIAIPTDLVFGPCEFIVDYTGTTGDLPKNICLLQNRLRTTFNDIGLIVTTTQQLKSFFDIYPGTPIISNIKSALVSNVPIDVLDKHVPLEKYLVPELQIQIAQGDFVQIQATIEQGALTHTPMLISNFRLAFTSIYPEKAAQFDEAVAQASLTLRHNKKALGYQIFYSYKLSKFGDLPIEVSELVAEYIGIYGQKFDTGETSVLRALVEREETASSTSTTDRVKALKQSAFSEGKMKEEEESEEADKKTEDSSNSKGGKAESPSDKTDVISNAHNDNNKRENNNKSLLEQLQQQDDTIFELKLPGSEAEKIQQRLVEDTLSEKNIKEKEEMLRELEDMREVKPHNILDKDAGEEKNTNEDPKTSMPEISDKFLYPPIPEEGVVPPPAPIISDPSLAGSGVISFAVTCGLLALHHGGKHFLVEGPVPDLSDLVS